MGRPSLGGSPEDSDRKQNEYNGKKFFHVRLQCRGTPMHDKSLADRRAAWNGAADVLRALADRHPEHETRLLGVGKSLQRAAMRASYFPGDIKPESKALLAWPHTSTRERQE
jgi:hypothetical protein